MTKPLSPDDLMTALWAVHHNGSTLRAILTTIKEAGWKIMPVEATEEMVEAANEADRGMMPWAAQYAAVLAAAPQIEGE